MSPALTAAVLVQAVVVGVAAVASGVRRHRSPAWLEAGVWVLQAFLAVQAVALLVAAARGTGPARAGLAVAYGAAGVALLPVCGAQRRDAADPAGERGTWLRVAVASAGVVVVQCRLVTLGGEPRG